MEQTQQVIPPKKVETLHQIKLRHKRELKALKKTPTKGKGAKKALRVKEQKLLKQHAEEIEQAKQKKKVLTMDESNPKAEMQADAVSDKNTKDETLPIKLSKAQRRRKRKEEREKERHAQIDKEILGMKDLRADEMEQLGKKLSALSMEVEEIPSDGHCLYRAIGDQLSRKTTTDELYKEFYEINESEPLHMALRRLAAKTIRLHKSHFQLFLPDTDVESYCDAITGCENIVWGGHLEIAALSEYLGRAIIVHSAEGEPIEILPLKSNHAGGKERDLHISYHKHYYGLGEHYNSLSSITPSVTTPKNVPE